MDANVAILAQKKTSASWNSYLNSIIAEEISVSTRYYDQVIQWMKRPEDNGVLYEHIECRNKSVEPAHFPDLSSETDRRSAVLLNGVFNHHFDIESILSDLRPKLSRTSRVFVNAYNPYLSWLYVLANKLGIRQGEQPTTFVTATDLRNIGRLSGFEVVREVPVGFFPWKFLGLGSLINHLFAALPFFSLFCFAHVIVLRPLKESKERHPSLSIVIPARNERGNIENALRRMPNLGTKDVEVIFVEGHSNDGTWEEILRVQNAYSGKVKIRAYQQTGRGKSDAVRLGFSKAKGDVLTILDADLTMPPELLGRFYDAYSSGLADFVNGTRLVYPMEGHAMRFLNRLGNIFFAKALSWVLRSRIGDSLCGTKLMARHDYDRIVAWRKDFGDFDPFGDFELLFPAAVLGLGIVDVPVRYRARTYGVTNISRFKHGLMLLKMTLIGFFKIRMGKG